jgi:hypothetical protein
MNIIKLYCVQRMGVDSVLVSTQGPILYLLFQFSTVPFTYNVVSNYGMNYILYEFCMYCMYKCVTFIVYVYVCVCVYVYIYIYIYIYAFNSFCKFLWSVYNI